ncbi:MAG TPA: MarR family transcriptional regulator [Candidatus Limosilactobacillus intestinigallinarum]|nr:MarR family transcriptional regulator [Candidatus Limosilactobacillus intestinigallinarum]
MTVTDEEFFKHWAGLVKDINSTIQCTAQPSNFRGQGRIIGLIAHHEGCSQRELATLAGVKPGSLTEVLERLERNAYVIRRRDDRDRRIIRVDLTDRGRCFHAELTAQRAAFVHYLLKNVSPQERQQFVRVVDKIRTQLHEYDGGSFMKKAERDEDN